MRIFGIVMPALVLLSACPETRPSEEIDTDGIEAFIDVEAGDRTSRVEVELKFGSTFLELSGGDQVFAHVTRPGGSTDTVQLNEPSVAASFDTNSENTEYRIELRRTSKVDAPDSIGTLPAPFVLIPDGASFSRANDNFAVRWSPSVLTDAVIRYEVNGSCIQTKRGSLDPSSSSGLEIGNGVLTESGQESESCPIDIQIRLVRDGAVDTKLNSRSRFELSQTRDLRLETMP